MNVYTHPEPLQALPDLSVGDGPADDGQTKAGT